MIAFLEDFTFFKIILITFFLFLPQEKCLVFSNTNVKV